jgi:hypothetical protein
MRKVTGSPSGSLTAGKVSLLAATEMPGEAATVGGRLEATTVIATAPFTDPPRPSLTE